MTNIEINCFLRYQHITQNKKLCTMHPNEIWKNMNNI